MPNRMPHVKWPHTYPICMLLGVVWAVGLTAATGYIQYRMLQPLQRYYLGSFIKSCVLPMKQDVKFIEVWTHSEHGGYVMAVDPWIKITREHNQTVFALTDGALQAGLSRPRFYEARVINPKTIQPFYESSIYHGTVPATFRVTLCVLGIALAAGMVTGAWFDQKHQEAARRGVQIRGPLLMDPRKAHKYLKGDGIALFLEPKSR
jgi:hypothetical protein